MGKSIKAACLLIQLNKTLLQCLAFIDVYISNLEWIYNVLYIYSFKLFIY